MKSFEIFVRTLKIMKNKLPLYLVSIILMTVLSSLFEVSNSVFTKQILDCANKTISDGTLKFVMTILFGIISIMLGSIFMDIYNNHAKSATMKLKTMVFEKSLKMPMQYYNTHNSGELISMSVYDTDIASNIYSSRLRRVLAPVISVIVFAIAMLIMNPIMAFSMLLINTILFLLNALITKPVKAAGKQLSYANTLMTQQLSAIIEGAATNRIYDVNGIQLEKFQNADRSYVTAQRRKMRLTSLQEALNTGFDMFCALMFVAVGLVLMQNGFAQMGEIAGIYTMYSILSFRFLQLGKNYPELMNCIAYASKIFSFLDEAEESDILKRKKDDVQAEKKEISDENAVEIRNLTYGYTNDIFVIENKTLVFPKNKYIALTGKSGCGKSTLAKLILGYYPLQEGNVYIFGKDINEWGVDNVRNLVTYIPQESFLYEMSILKNIWCVKPEASKEEVVRAARLAYAHEFIEKLEYGYDTVMNSHGCNLSGGERQRIAIARAILKDTPIIIMDEATAALDNESEQLVAAALKNISHNKTIIMIAHRRTTIDRADIIIQM